MKKRAQKFLWDLSGAFGDIGVFFPIGLALIEKNSFNPTALFLMAGLFYIFSSYYFKITMSVQPLKAMSAIAIASGLGYEIINTAGIMMGIVFVFISLTGISMRLGKMFPLSVVKGIQFGLGLILVKTSLAYMNLDLSVSLIAATLLFVFAYIIRGIPILIPILILGILFSLRHTVSLTLGPIPFSFVSPDMNNLWFAFSILVLPQIALSFGNAVVATEATAKILYPKRSHRINMKSIPLSMGIANIVSGFFGGGPMCHGSGGITAHNKFGARTERSGYIIGLFLIILALGLGKSSLSIIASFPQGILGVMLCYVGIQHSLFIKDTVQDRLALFTALTVALSGFLTNNLTIGFLLGLGVHYSFIGLRKTAHFFEKGERQ